jgi:tetratricopeptide (TPR) repeat protein
MLTTKNRVGKLTLVALASIALLGGCMPRGPRALLDGQRLVESGNYALAIESLRVATTLLPTNAYAWNYLGLACQYSEKPVEADRAYRLALKYDPDLTEVHFNLGCLWLAQNSLEAAKSEFTAFVLHRENSVEGFIMLGAAQLRSVRPTPPQARARDLDLAEASFSRALQLRPQSPEALNGRGVARVQRARLNEGIQDFRAALNIRSNYPAALLNLAVASQQMRDRQVALQAYRQYMALQPAPEQSEVVRAAIIQLEQEINQLQRSAPPPSRPGTTNSAGNKPSGAPFPGTQPEAPAFANSPTQRLETAVVGTNLAATAGVSEKPSAKRGLLQWLFGSSDKKSSPATSSPPEKDGRTGMSGSGTGVAPTSARYAYRSPARPAQGNRTEAQKAFLEGISAQQSSRLPDALRFYRQATQLDPAFYDAHFNLGAAAVATGNLPLALDAYENALAARPDSIDARYNFALALQQAKCFEDAANELERILAASSNDVRAHLALANLCILQLQQLPRARQHYLKVLEIDPKLPQASAIREWLRTHP